MYVKPISKLTITTVEEVCERKSKVTTVDEEISVNKQSYMEMLMYIVATKAMKVTFQSVLFTYYSNISSPCFI